MLYGRPCRLQRCREQPPAATLVPGTRRAYLTTQRGVRARVDGGEPQRDRPRHVAQLEPGQRRSEQDVHVAATGRRYVGEDLAAEVLKQLAELGRLAVDVAPVHVQVQG